MVEWSKFFDKIWCIHYVKHKSRLLRMFTELARVGILRSRVFDWFYDYDSPFFKTIQKNSQAFPGMQEICSDKSYSYFKCSFSHYRAWKEMCCRGY